MKQAIDIPRDAALCEQITTLQAVLARTQDIAASLSPLDIGSFEQAVAARSEVLRSLEKTLTTQETALRGELTSPEHGPLMQILRGLAESIQATEARNRDLSNAALHALRMELREVRDGQRALQGYRNPTSPDPRFANRQG